jgi:hypothetical protein
MSNVLKRLVRLTAGIVAATPIAITVFVQHDSRSV